MQEMVKEERREERGGMTLSFVLFPNKHFFNLPLLFFLLPFVPDKLGDTKTIRPFALKGHGSNC